MDGTTPDDLLLANSAEISLEKTAQIELAESNIISEILEEAQVKLEIIQNLIEPCDRAAYGEKLRDAAEKLGCSVRSVQRLIRKWENEGITALVSQNQADQGTHRITEFWRNFIIKTYTAENKDNKRTKPKQVAVKVQAKAREIGDDINLSRRH